MTTKVMGLDTDLLAQIDVLGLSEQAKGLRKAFFEQPIRMATERARIALQAWKESEGQPVELRWAHQLKRLAEQNPVVIHEGERLAGSETKWFRGVYPRMEIEPTVEAEFLRKGAVTLLAPDHRAELTKEDWQALADAVDYFSGKTGSDRVRQLRSEVMGTWWDDFLEARGSNNIDSGNLHSGVPLFEKVLKSGLRATIEEAKTRIAGFSSLQEDDPEKLVFWQAVVTTCEAVITLARRYADLALKMSGETVDPVRKRQLEQISEACRWVPENPARSFFEALQSMRLVHLGGMLEGGHANIGLLDQYLYPYFIEDLTTSRLTLQEATDLLANLFSYLGRLTHALRGLNTENFHASSAIINISLGGVTREGQDACNELTWLILHVAGLVKYAQPQLTIRWHRLTPKSVMLKALQTNYKVGGGIPQFHNSEHIIDYLVDRGLPLEEAREWVVYGCSNPYPVGRFSANIKDGGWINISLALDLALHNGIAPKTGKRIGIETGDPRTFKSFDDVYGAFKKQLDFILRRCVWHCRFFVKTWAQLQRYPFLSSVLPGCVQNGKDLMLGGQGDHPVWYVKDRGIVNAADSLVALKRLVFDEKRLTMSELLMALDSNFQGERGDAVRRLCLAAPKYGNEDPEADAMVREIGKLSASIIFSERNPFGQPYAINRNGMGWHYYGGKGVAAMPDGRKAFEPFANGSLSPMVSDARAGPTAVMNSALVADFKEAAVAILNVRFPRTLAQSQEGLEKLASLTDTFMRQGGTHVQYNLLDHRVLLEAKKDPEKFKDLVVRVAGYSAYFIHLAPEVQDEIIRRAEFSL